MKKVNKVSVFNYLTDRFLDEVDQYTSLLDTTFKDKEEVNQVKVHLRSIRKQLSSLNKSNSPPPVDLDLLIGKQLYSDDGYFFTIQSTMLIDGKKFYVAEISDSNNHLSSEVFIGSKDEIYDAVIVASVVSS